MDKYTYVKHVIDEWDPIGLLGMGCPDDEYDPEIKDIVKLLSHSQSVVELAEGIHQVFLDWFGEDLPLTQCYPAAIRIFAVDFEKNMENRIK